MKSALDVEVSSEVELPLMIRLFLRTVVFLAVTLFLGSLIWTLLFVGYAFVFDPSVDTLFDVAEFGGGWPIFVGSMLLAGVIVWRFLPLRLPVKPQRTLPPAQ